MVSRAAAVGRWFIDIKTPGDVVEKVAYILAAGLFIALMVFVVAILGTMGVITLIGGFVLLIMLKWGWLWLLK